MPTRRPPSEPSNAPSHKPASKRVGVQPEQAQFDTDPATATATDSIVKALTRAIVEHRLVPGAKLGEQKLADHFGVSRTLIRQALFQMLQNGLIRMEPARGAFVAQPSVEEARQVFQVRRMIESGLAMEFARQVSPEQLQALRAHLKAEQAAVAQQDATERVALLGDFHVLLAQLMGNEVLADLLSELISRCALITLMYQSSHAAHDSAVEHSEIVEAFASADATRAARLMDEHLRNVEKGLAFPKTTRRERVRA